MKRHHLPRIARSLPGMSMLAFAAACALLGPATAAPVLGASTTAAVASGDGTSNTSSWPGPPSYLSSSTSANDGTGSAYGYSFANASGAYAVNSSAEGRGDATAHTSILYALTNTASVAMQYTMSFYIYGGTISSQLHNNYYTAGPTLEGDERLFASYGATISVGGVQRFASAATVAQTADGITWSKTGTDLNSSADGSDGSYSWNGASYTIDLGIVGAGETIDILAELDDMVIADVGTYDYSCGGGYGYGEGYGYGYGGGSTCTAFKGRAYAFYGDPWELSELPVPVTFTGTEVGQVPEPAGLALVGLGLAAAAATTRRRRPGVMADANGPGQPPGTAG